MLFLRLSLISLISLGSLPTTFAAPKPIDIPDVEDYIITFVDSAVNSNFSLLGAGAAYTGVIFLDARTQNCSQTRGITFRRARMTADVAEEIQKMPVVS